MSLTCVSEIIGGLPGLSLLDLRSVLPIHSLAVVRGTRASFAAHF